MQITLNDTQVVDVDLEKHLDKLEAHPGIARPQGYIGLQNHGTRVDYREIRVKRL